MAYIRGKYQEVAVSKVSNPGDPENHAHADANGRIQPAKQYPLQKSLFQKIPPHLDKSQITNHKSQIKHPPSADGTLFTKEG